MNEKVQAPSKNSLAPSPPQLKNTSQLDHTHFTEQTQATHSSGLIQPSFTDRRNIQSPAKSGSGFNFEFTKLPLYSSFVPTTNTQLGKIQRQETDEQKDEEEKAGLQMKSEGVIQTKCSQCEQQEKQQQNSKSTQAKLTVGEPGDKYEQEADRVAQQVMRMSAPESNQLIQPETLTEEEEKEDKLQAKSLAASITPLVQREVAIEGNSQISDNLESKLRASKGGGSPLSEEVRQFMEPRFNADFSHVRMHTDDKSAKMNQELNAQAFTHENNIFFGAGRYNSSSNEGKNLIAHELTHVVQQTGVVKRKVQESEIPILNGVAPKSQVLNHLQTLEKTNSSEARLYRKEILQFQRENSSEKIAALQRQVLEEPKSTDVRERDSSQSLRRCGGPTSRGGGGSPAASSCSVSGSFSSIPSGTLRATLSGNKLGSPFQMVGNFTPRIPCDCSGGEYRQYVRGSFTSNGSTVTHPLCGTNLDPTTFQEDCGISGGTVYKYGYRSIPFGNSRFRNPDQVTGCTFEGADHPGITGTTGDTLGVNLDFRGELIDTWNANRVIASSSWSVVGTTTVP